MSDLFQKKINVTSSNAVYLPGLNGLRAIAALAVVISHITLSLNQFGLNSNVFGTDTNGSPKGLDLAGDGVTIFFALSGFLITFLFLKEKENGSISIKNFYVRRILRIWPLYYLYFFIAIITAVVFGITLNKFSVPFYFFLAANIPFILNQSLPFLAHYWSLGVEEQFYLLFPQMAKQSNKRLLRLTIALAISLFFLKIFFWVLKRKYGTEIPLLAITVTRFNVMFTGVIGAVLFYNNNKNYIAIVTHKITQLFSWACVFFILINRFHIASVIDQDLIAIISVVLITGQVTRKNYIINLENKACDFIGKISYGIYVIHPLLIFFYEKIFGKFLERTVFNYIIIYYIIIATTIMLAFFSYKFYEKPFLNLKEKFAVIKTSDTKGLYKKEILNNQLSLSKA